MNQPINLHQRINLCLLFLKAGGELVVNERDILAIPEGMEEPGFKFHSTGKVIQVGSPSAWNELIIFARSMTSESSMELINSTVASEFVKISEIKSRALAAEPGDLILKPAEELSEFYGPSFKGCFGIETPDKVLIYPDGRLKKANGELFVNARRDILQLVDLLETLLLTEDASQQIKGKAS